MPSIQRRVGRDGAVTWRVRVRVLGRPIQTASFRRKTDAQIWASKTENSLRDGHHLPNREERRRTVAELFAKYRVEVLPGYSRREQGQRLGKLAWWEAQLGALPVGDLTTARIIECRAKLARGEGLSGEVASAATQVRYLALLKHVMSTAKNEWEWLDDNPAARVRGPKEPRGRVRFLSEEERERLLAACRGSSEHRLHALVVLALATGARQGEPRTCCIF
jgi:integrase